MRGHIKGFDCVVVKAPTVVLASSDFAIAVRPLLDHGPSYARMCIWALEKRIEVGMTLDRHSWLLPAGWGTKRALHPPITDLLHDFFQHGLPLVVDTATIEAFPSVTLVQTLECLKTDGGALFLICPGQPPWHRPDMANPMRQLGCQSLHIGVSAASEQFQKDRDLKKTRRVRQSVSGLNMLR